MWKLGLAALALAVAGIGMVLGETILSSISADRYVAVMMSSVVIGLGSLVFACVALRCPCCQARWVWMAVSGQAPIEWLPWLMSLVQCPRCDVKLTASSPSTY